MVRLFINVGRKHRVQAKDIVGAIAGEAGIPGKLVGTIDIYDKYTFVEVPKANAKKVLEKFEAEIKQMKENDIDLAHFQRVKNMIYGNYVKEYDDVAEICRMFVGDYMKGINSFEYIEEYEQVTPEYTKQVLEEVFKEQKTVLSIVEK